MRVDEIVNVFFPNGAENLADSIGPQSNIIEKLADFNTKYAHNGLDQPLKITKKWRWSPGTYDKVKICYTRKIMQWHRRPRHMHSIFDRRRDWYSNDMKRELNTIENALIKNRRECAVWLDENTDDGFLDQIVAEFTYKVQSLLPIAAEHDIKASFWQATHSDISAGYHQNPERPNELVDNTFIFLFDLPQKDIVVTKGGELIEKIEFPALSLYVKIDATKWFGALMNPTLSWNNIWNTEYFNLGIHYKVPKDWVIPGAENFFDSENVPIYHPFVGRHDRSPLRDGQIFRWRNICMGSYETNIVSAFMNMDWNAFFYHIDEWLFKYEIVQANPLNNIRLSFLGVDKNMNTELLDAVGYNGRDCASRLFNIFRSPLNSEKEMTEGVLNFCENTRQCTHISKCEGYKINQDRLKTMVDLSTDQKEMLKWAKDVSRGRVG